jgi:predicted HD phosphohydrolase
LNHTYQTYDFVQQKRKEFLKFDKKEMPVWSAFDFLNQLVDDSDPDTDLDQFQHLLQTSEAIRADGHPDWMVLVGLMHDMGKCSVYLVNHSGPLSVTRSLLDVLTLIKLFTRSILKIILIFKTSLSN